MCNTKYKTLKCAKLLNGLSMLYSTVEVIK